MKRVLLFVTMVCLVAMLSACAVPDSNEALLEFNENCSFADLKLGMTANEMLELLGEPSAANPISSGTEYAYYDLDLSVTVDDNDVIRRFSGMNTEFSVFGLAVGGDVETAVQVLQDNGYERDAASGYRFNKNEVQIILLTIDNETTVGFSAEWLS